jgi:hypothetical protein
MGPFKAQPAGECRAAALIEDIKALRNHVTEATLAQLKVYNQWEMLV